MSPPPLPPSLMVIFSSPWLSTAGSETLMGVSQPQLPSPCQGGSQERSVLWFWGLSGSMSKLPTSLASITIVHGFWIMKLRFLQGSDVAALGLRRPSSGTMTLGKADTGSVCPVPAALGPHTSFFEAEGWHFVPWKVFLL